MQVMVGKGIKKKRVIKTGSHKNQQLKLASVKKIIREIHNQYNLYLFCSIYVVQVNFQ